MHGAIVFGWAFNFGGYALYPVFTEAQFLLDGFWRSARRLATSDIACA